ncbi:XRE family transcriptional regulator [Myceligenerans pegani]|uniref:XRE family transcriptional regulator n=1 Tax=Myceligenerans pegani TaxID=2776917 RepID=A0ABR9MXJ6_9MICO|nr:XRE family transcriptional regulator [Myceligenerans sp. TRM 65318]MBE1876109.1 XRE family transcriptional regulator [Myceligenerans sp. TRM 65318]MBE3018380.1 XRE family transcriptional regulator [Myceligenerans sp. TRM 65318]
MTERPEWAERIRRERSTRGWSQAQTVTMLRAIYTRQNGREGGSQESLLRQWKDWESGRVRPTVWAPYIAETFGTVAGDLFPPERPAGDSELLREAGMDTAELIARLQRSTISDTTVTAIQITVDRLCSEYRYRSADELRIEGMGWLNRIGGMLDQRLSLRQHRDLLALSGRLALLVGCVEQDTGASGQAEATRRYALDLAHEVDERDVMGWAHEMSAWFALTNGDLHRVIAASEHGIEVAGARGVAAQLAAQAAKAWSRLGNSRQAELSLERGRVVLADLPSPHNPDDHFVVDPSKWHYYEMDVHRNVGNDSLAQLYAEETLRAGVRPDGVERNPMRNQEARITLAVVAARAGDADAALDYGLQALEGDRRSAPSLTLVAHELSREFERARLTDDPRARAYSDAIASIGR